jgi:hypothetical protein
VPFCVGDVAIWGGFVAVVWAKNAEMNFGLTFRLIAI